MDLQLISLLNPGERHVARESRTLVIGFPTPCCTKTPCPSTFESATWASMKQSLKRHLLKDHGLTISGDINYCLSCSATLGNRPAYHSCTAPTQASSPAPPADNWFHTITFRPTIGSSRSKPVTLHTLSLPINHRERRRRRGELDPFLSRNVPDHIRNPDPRQTAAPGGAATPGPGSEDKRLYIYKEIIQTKQEKSRATHLGWRSAQVCTGCH